jgi:hypothetical protein
MLATGNPHPDVNPDALVDAQGRLILAWSGYDGKDYEIYASSWAGADWTPAVKFTGGRNRMVSGLADEGTDGRCWSGSSPRFGTSS